MQIRFDPTTSGGDIKIDYIRFEGDVIVSDDSDDDFMIEEDSGESHITKANDEISWEFDTNGTLDGWSFNKHLANIILNNGHITATVTGPSPEMVTNGDLKLDTSKIKNIKILSCAYSLIYFCIYITR
jgi:hypothetical protein